MNQKLVVGVISAALLVSSADATLAAPKLNQSCSKVNTFTTVGEKIIICSKSGRKFVWVSATSAQKIQYNVKQLKIQKSNRIKEIENLNIYKSKYSDVILLIQPLNETLIETKKAYIKSQRDALAVLMTQRDREIQNRDKLTSDITGYTNSISSDLSKISSLQAQSVSQQSTLTLSEQSQDSAYNSYISAKAQSDYLSYSYQTAIDDNVAMLSAKVLCDFGFGSCGIYSSSRYNYNASIITQYNSAKARTQSAHSVYLSAIQQHITVLETLISLKTQQMPLTSAINTLNAQRSQAIQNFASSQAQISFLDSQVAEATNKLTPLDAAEVRIAQDLDSYSSLKENIEVKAAELITAMENFLQIANAQFIDSASLNTWSSKMQPLLLSKKEIDNLLDELKARVNGLDAFLDGF